MPMPHNETSKPLISVIRIKYNPIQRENLDLLAKSRGMTIEKIMLLALDSYCTPDRMKAAQKVVSENTKTVRWDVTIAAFAKKVSRFVDLDYEQESNIKGAKSKLDALKENGSVELALDIHSKIDKAKDVKALVNATGFSYFEGVL